MRSKEERDEGEGEREMEQGDRSRAKKGRGARGARGWWGAASDCAAMAGCAGGEVGLECRADAGQREALGGGERGRSSSARPGKPAQQPARARSSKQAPQSARRSVRARQSSVTAVRRACAARGRSHAQRRQRQRQARPQQRARRLLGAAAAACEAGAAQQARRRHRVGETSSARPQLPPCVPYRWLCGEQHLGDLLDPPGLLFAEQHQPGALD